MTTLGNKIGIGSGNNLNAIRLALAVMVILSHSFPLTYGSGAKSDPLFQLTHLESFGSVAVDLFFFISGMLITASWLRSKSMSEYLMKRVLRIYPGYIVALFFSGLMVWVFCAEFRQHAGRGLGWSAMFVNDCVFLKNQCLTNEFWKGIFAHNPFPGYANGSLWTIPLEFSCYLLVLALGLFCLFKRRSLILLGTLIVYAVYAQAVLAGTDTVFIKPRFFTYFLAGTCVWLWRDRIPFSDWIALGFFAALAGLLAISQLRAWFSILFPVAGSYCTLWLAYRSPVTFLGWTNKTDLSYGTYLYAFPVQQLVAMQAAFHNPWMNSLFSIPIVLMLAWLSWNLIEKRFLALKHASLFDFDPGNERTKTVPRETIPGRNKELNTMPPG